MAVKASNSITIADISDGTDGTGIKSTVVEYQAGASGTTAPTGTWKTAVDSTSAAKPYLWTRVTYTYTDNSTKVVYSVGSTPEGIEVGGRNLIPFTTLNYLLTGQSTREFTVSGWAYRVIDSTNLLNILEPSTIYTIYYCAELIERTTVPTVFLHLVGFLFYSQSTGGVDIDCRIPVQLTEINEKYIYKKTFTTPSVLPNDYSLLVYTNRYTTNGNSPIGYDTIKFTNFKLEKGNKATDWTPAPEDVDSKIDTAQNTANNAQSSANNAQSTANAAQSTANAAQSTADTANTKANNAQSTANTARTEAANAAKTATNFMELTSNGLVVGDKTAETLGRNILIGNSTIQFKSGTDTILAEYGEDTIYLGKNSKQSRINLCNGMAELYNEDSGSSYNRLAIRAGHSISLNAPNAVYIDSDYYGTGSTGEAYIHIESYPVWESGSSPGGIMELCASKDNEYYSELLLHSQRVKLEAYSSSASAILSLDSAGDYATLAASTEVTIEAPTITAQGSLYPKAGIFLPANGTWYLGGKTETNCIVGYPQSSNSYHPVLRITSATGNVWNIGGISDDIGIYGYYAGRTENGYDFSTIWNASNGNLIHSREYISTYPNGLRIVYGAYGFFIRNDGADTYFMLTNAWDQYGIWNSLRPFHIHNDNGDVYMETTKYLKGATYIYNITNQYRIVFNSYGNLIPTNAAGTDGSYHANLGSSTNYWGTLYYSALSKVSDRRKKNDLGDLDSEEATLLLRNVKPKKYTMIDETNDRIQYGVYAQDIRDLLKDKHIGYRSLLSIGTANETGESFTDLNMPEDDVTYGIDYLQFISLLIKGWQCHEEYITELQENYNNLYSQLQSAFGQIEALRDKVHELEMAS